MKLEKIFLLAKNKEFLSALYKKSEILILDETTNAVDELTQDKIMNEIFSYAKVNNMTVIVVSHDQKVLYKCEKKFYFKTKKLLVYD